jgi:GT2 family glycosyltransferase
MEKALSEGAEVILWLNHDCVPDQGVVERLVEEASVPGRGGVSAWCYCREGREFGVNPGFKHFQEIDDCLLREGELVEVDGTNGNCVALNANAVRSVGLPEARRHPHYGDGPYLWRLHRAGFRNFVLPTARAALDREFDRCISERDHSKVWKISFFGKLRYYFFSNRSKFHWRNKFWDSLCFQGRWKGPFHYLLAQAKLMMEVYRGHREGRRADLEVIIRELVDKYGKRFPPLELEASLRNLAKRT